MTSVLEGIDDFHTLDFPAVLHIFGKEDSATCLFCRANDQSIPEGEAVKAMEVDRTEQISNVDLRNIELGQ